MSRPWSATAAELRRIEAWVLHTTVTPDDIARTLKAPVEAVRAIVADVKRNEA